jgi:hypothetical protein
LAEETKASPRLALEVLVIIFSILVAFAVDAWWDQRQEDREEVLVLRSVLDEARANQLRLDDRRLWQHEVLSAIDALLEVASAPTATATPDSIDHLLADASFWGSSAWETAAVDAVVAGGGLARVSDPMLRQALTGWQRQLELVTQNEREDFDTFFGVWMPFLREHANLPQINNATINRPGSDEPYEFGGVPEFRPMDHTLLLQSQEFRNVIMQWKWSHESILSRYDSTEPVLDHLVQMLTQALAGEAP